MMNASRICSEMVLQRLDLVSEKYNIPKSELFKLLGINFDEPIKDIPIPLPLSITIPLQKITPNQTPRKREIVEIIKLNDLVGIEIMKLFKQIEDNLMIATTVAELKTVWRVQWLCYFTKEIVLKSGDTMIQCGKYYNECQTRQIFKTRWNEIVKLYNKLVFVKNKEEIALEIELIPDDYDYETEILRRTAVRAANSLKLSNMLYRQTDDSLV